MPDLPPDPAAYVTEVSAPAPVVVLQQLHSHMKEPEPDLEAEL